MKLIFWCLLRPQYRQKFVFAEDTVDYVGFTITRDEIRPSAAMTESIRNFPAPKNITQARAFFGLVEQVSFAFSKCEDMVHFRHLLSPKTQFVWTEDLQREFILAKANIVRKIEKGVTIFEVDRITALVCDWSIEGQSLGLWQKHCNCSGKVTILCCRGGWKIICMASRFNNAAQRNYSPIEGECLTVFWALQKADFFVYGAPKLYIGSDHKPLLGFFRKIDPKPLDAISNKRLRRYVAAIGEHRFTMFHIEGAKNYLADLGSRLPTGDAGNDRGDGEAGDGDSARVIGAEGAEIRVIEGCKWQPTTLPKDDIYSHPTFAQIFAYGANTPSDDPEVLGGGMMDSDDYASQCLTEIASYMSLSAGQRISVAMTTDKIKSEIQLDS